MIGMDTAERLYEIFREHPSVTTDSRKVNRGDMFFALRGDNFNGNRFADMALAAGASVAVIDDNDFYKEDGRHILVDDVLATLQSLARHHRRMVAPKVLAITGSSGKTTTKELTATVLSRKYGRLCYTHGNLNNHIGVPLTLLTMPFDCDMAIIEMGASAQGEIRALCSIAEPDMGIITNIGNAHLGGFGGPEGIKKGKGELYDFLAAHNGVGFIRKEDATLCEMADRCGLRNRVYYKGVDGRGFTTQLVGDYNTLNIAATVAIGRKLGVTEPDIRKAVESYIPTNNRSQLRETGRNTLIVDCYNANPLSMKVMIDNFVGMRPSTNSKKMMILGDMLELGEWSAECHRDVIRQALGSDCEYICLVGNNFIGAIGTMGSEVAKDKRLKLYADCASLRRELTDNPVSGATVLIKGSHSIGLEKCIELL